MTGRRIKPKDGRSSMQRAIAALAKERGRAPSNGEENAWAKSIDELGKRHRSELDAALNSDGGARCWKQLEEIRSAAKQLSDQLDNLSRDAYYLLRFAPFPTADGRMKHCWRTDEEVWMQELADEIKGPRDDGGLLSNRMKALEKMARIAQTRIPDSREGDHSIYEGQVGPVDLGFIGECCRLMHRLSGGTKHLPSFARAARDHALPNSPAGRDWGKEHLKTVKAWWERLGPHDLAIFEAGKNWPQEGDRWEWIARETGLPLETVCLSWGPHVLRGTLSK